MAFIGNTNTTQAFTPAVDYFSGNGSTTAFTLSRPVASVAQVQVVINNVAQNPSSAYTVSSNTITFTSAPSSGTNNIYVYYTSPITQVIAPSQGTVDATSLASSTGTGAVVLATSPTITTPTINSISSASATALTLKSAGTTAVTIDTSQQVGIGTTSPIAVLDVASGSNPAVRIRNTSTGGAGIWFGNSTSGTTTGDGSNVGIDSSQQLNLWNYENTATLFATNNTERMRIDSSGNLLVGRTTTTGSLGGDTPIVFANGAFCSYVGSYNAQYSSDRINFNNANYYVVNGSTVGVKLVSGSTSWTTQSDERTKTDLVPIANGLQKVNTLRAVTGRYTKDQEGVSRAFLIAQDVKAVLPEAVDEDTDEAKTLGLRYTEVIPLLVASIKELKAINDTQAETINALTARVAALENK